MLRAAILLLVSLRWAVAEIPEDCRKIVDNPAYRLDRGDPSTAYSIREDRCEGVIKKPLSGNVDLQLLSFTSARPPGIDDPTVVVNWAETNGNLRLAVTSSQAAVLYRMDTQ